MSKQPGFEQTGRRRAVAAGALVALTAGLGLALTTSSAAAGSTGSESTFTSITPCRLVDTRPGSDNVGTRRTRIGADEAAAFTVWGTNGRCAIPQTATAIVTNVTAIAPTASSFLTVYPGDAARPLAANINTTAGGPPTPNQVTVGLSATGDIRVYNFAGSADVVIDIVGYFQAVVAGTGLQGAPGPKGDPGAPGPKGDTGAAGAAGISGYQVVVLAGVVSPGQRDRDFTVTCPAGKTILSGGVATFNKDIEVTTSTPDDTGTRWGVSTTTYSGNNVTIASAVNIRVICAFVTP